MPVGPKIENLLTTASRYHVQYILVTPHDRWEEPGYPEILTELKRRGIISEVYDAGGGREAGLRYCIFRVIGAALPEAGHGRE